MLTLNEAVIIRTFNERIARFEASLAACQRTLQNERASRRQEREAYELTLAACNQRMRLLEEMVVEG